MRKKPKIKYTEMCMYIDEHIYEKNHDVAKIFDYMQCLFYALAVKKRFFGQEKYYDEYSLYAATQLYLRYQNKNQFLPEDDPKHMPKIKSVLKKNKKTLYPSKVNYQQQFFEQAVKDEGNDIATSEMYSNIRESNSEYLSVDIIEYFDNLPKTIKSFLKLTPYADDKVTLHNIYISCLITLLRCFTLSNYNKDRLISKKTETYRLNIDNLLQEMYVQEQETAPVAFHLEPGMDSYISVLTNKIKKLIAKDIKHLISYYEVSDEIVKDILIEPLSDIAGESIDD